MKVELISWPRPAEAISVSVATRSGRRTASAAATAPPMGVTDQMHTLDAKFGQGGLDGVGQRVGIPGTDALARSAVPWQVQGDRPAAFHQHGLGEHPAIEIGTETVQKQDRH